MSARALDPGVAQAVEAAGQWIDSPMALVLGGSHARGEAVWRMVGDARLCFSDIDLHAIVAGEPARRATAPRIAAGRPALETRLLALGFAAPLELGIHTVTEWAALPARPATLELREAGQVVAGDPVWLERLPRYTSRDIPAEEIRLLLENRAFELIGARPERTPEPAAELAAAHAQYKTALDLATVERLDAGAFERDAADRVRAAREHRFARSILTPEPAWDAALAWIRGDTPEPAARVADWWVITERWVAQWSAHVAPGVDPADFAAVARAAARRARARRRVRLALRPEIPDGLAPAWGSRLRHALTGTPQHRLNASAGAFLAAAVLAHRSPGAAAEIRARLAPLLDELGAVRPAGEYQTAERLLATWHRWVLAGTRGAARP